MNACPRENLKSMLKSPPTGVLSKPCASFNNDGIARNEIQRNHVAQDYTSTRLSMYAETSTINWFIVDLHFLARLSAIAVRGLANVSRGDLQLLFFLVKRLQRKRYKN